MALEIIFDNHANKTYSIGLDGVLHRINMRYNTLDDKWYFSLYNADNEPLLLGHKVTISRPMLLPYRKSDFPTGEFIFLLPSALRDPGRDDIEDLLLFYLTEEEYDTLSS